MGRPARNALAENRCGPVGCGRVGPVPSVTAFHSLSTGARPRLRLSFSVLAFSLLVLPAFLRADSLRLKSAEIVTGAVQGLDGDKVVLSLPLGSGNAAVPYPLALVDAVTLDRTPAEEALLKGTPAPADLPAWRAFWGRRAPFLRLPGSDSGAVGLGLARLLLESDPAQAGTVAEAISGGDWNQARGQQARAVALAALFAQGRLQQAQDAVRTLLVGVTDPTARVDVRFVFGQMTLAQWNAFAAAHPQWRTIPSQSAAQNVLAERALDALAAAPVFLPGDAARAGRGLLAAAAAAVAMDRSREAGTLLDDLLEAFPAAPQAAEAKALRERLDAAGLFTAATSS